MVFGREKKIKFDYLIIATGSSYSFPGKLVEPSIELAADKMRRCQNAIRDAEDITVVGGGPAGCELAGEICTEWPSKKVTLIHKGDKLCGRYGLQDVFCKKLCDKLLSKKVNVIVGER